MAASSSGHRVGDLAQHLGQRHVERRAQRGEQLGGRFLLAALDLGDVAQADPGLGGDLAQGQALLRRAARSTSPSSRRNSTMRVAPSLVGSIAV